MVLFQPNLYRIACLYFVTFNRRLNHKSIHKLKNKYKKLFFYWEWSLINWSRTSDLLYYLKLELPLRSRLVACQNQPNLNAMIFSFHPTIVLMLVALVARAGDMVYDVWITPSADSFRSAPTKNQHTLGRAWVWVPASKHKVLLLRVKNNYNLSPGQFWQ